MPQPRRTPQARTKATAPTAKLPKLSFLSPRAGFLGLQAGQVQAEPDAIIIPFGLESSVSYGGGTAAGPAAILKASHQVELFDESRWLEPHTRLGVATLKPFPIAKQIPAALEQLATVVGQVLDLGKFPMVLGGEHALSAGAIRPFAERYPQITILHFDAHADLRDGYEGEHFSHAAALRRCLDHDNVRLVSLGIRNISASEIPFLEQNQKRISIFWGKDMASWQLPAILRAVGQGPVYLSFDIDAFDSSLMPATGTPEPGGLFWNQTIEIIEAVAAQTKIVGADVVELAPKPNLHACDFVAAKLVFKILTAALLRGGPAGKRAKSKAN